MTKTIFKLINLVILFCFFGLKTATAQNKVKSYDHYNDTLLVLCDTLFDSDKIHVNREFLLECDSLYLNQKGLMIERFTMSAIALGQNASLVSKGATITEAMKNNLIIEQKNFKFIYIKNIILRTNDGRELHPSTESVKIVFLN